MQLGPYIYMLWLAVLVSSLVVAGIHLVRRPFQGVGPALAAITGALLSWALVSAYIGSCEIGGYTGSRAFAVSMALGIAGLGSFVWSCTRLGRRLRKIEGQA